MRPSRGQAEKEPPNLGISHRTRTSWHGPLHLHLRRQLYPPHSTKSPCSSAKTALPVALRHTVHRGLTWNPPMGSGVGPPEGGPGCHCCGEGGTAYDPGGCIFCCAASVRLLWVLLDSAGGQGLSNPGTIPTLLWACACSGSGSKWVVPRGQCRLAGPRRPHDSECFVATSVGRPVPSGQGHANPAGFRIHVWASRPLSCSDQ